MRNDGHHINTTHLTAAQRHLSSREVGRGRSAGRWVGGGQATGLREAVWCLPPPTAYLSRCFKRRQVAQSRAYYNLLN